MIDSGRRPITTICVLNLAAIVSTDRNAIGSFTNVCAVFRVRSSDTYQFRSPFSPLSLKLRLSSVQTLPPPVKIFFNWFSLSSSSVVRCSKEYLLRNDVEGWGVRTLNGSWMYRTSGDLERTLPSQVVPDLGHPETRMVDCLVSLIVSELFSPSSGLVIIVNSRAWFVMFGSPALLLIRAASLMSLDFKRVFSETGVVHVPECPRNLFSIRFLSASF